MDREKLESYSKTGEEHAFLIAIALLFWVIVSVASLDNGATTMEAALLPPVIAVGTIIVGAIGLALFAALATVVGYIEEEIPPRIERWRK